MDDHRGVFVRHPAWQHAGDGHPLMHALLLVLLVALLVAAAVWLFRRLAQPRLVDAAPVTAVAGPAGEAIGLVRLRYARGEIGRDEFRQMSIDLGAAPVPLAPDPPAAPWEGAPGAGTAAAPTAPDETAEPTEPAE